MATSHALPPTTQVKDYTILQKIGAGGFGITYLVQDPKGQQLVLKELFISGNCIRNGKRVQTQELTIEEFEAHKKRFVREGTVLTHFDHPHIVDAHYIFEENNTVYIAMEYIEGETLLHKIEEEGYLNIKDGIRIISQIGEALQHIHNKKFYHRDVKPANIIIRPNGDAVLIDFGLAKEIDSLATLNHTQAFSLGYSPIEQRNAKTKIGAYTDVYALGATLYHALCGEIPLDVMDRFKHQLTPPSQLNKRLTPEFEKVILKAMEMDETKRQQSVKEFLRGFDVYIDDDKQKPTFQSVPKKEVDENRKQRNNNNKKKSRRKSYDNKSNYIEGYKILKRIDEDDYRITYLVESPNGKKAILKELFIDDFNTRKGWEVTAKEEGDNKKFSALKREYLKNIKDIHLTYHPNLANITKVFEANNTIYYITDLIEGKTLLQKIEKKGKLEIDESIKIITKIGKGLEYLHKKKIYHLNISPANIIIDNNNIPVLVNYNVVDEIPTLQADKKLFNFNYSPPEQRFDIKINPTIDIYALGATLYHCVCGIKPEEPYVIEKYKINRIEYLVKPTKLNRAISPVFEKIILKSLKDYVHYRYQTVNEFIEDLNNDDFQIRQKAKEELKELDNQTPSPKKYIYANNDFEDDDSNNESGWLGCFLTITFCILLFGGLYKVFFIDKNVVPNNKKEKYETKKVEPNDKPKTTKEDNSPPPKSEKDAWMEINLTKSKENYNNFITTYPESEYIPLAKNFRDDVIAWEKADSINTESAYKEFLEVSKTNLFYNEAQYQIDNIESITWNKAKKENTEKAYRSFLKNFPKSLFVLDAKKNIEKIYWLEAYNTDTKEAAKNFLKKYPKGFFKKEAIEFIEFKDWTEASEKNTTTAYKTFLKLHPKGEYKEEANIKINTLEKFPTEKWEEAKKINSIEAYKTYIEDFPYGKHTKEAVKLLKLKESYQNNWKKADINLIEVEGGKFKMSNDSKPFEKNSFHTVILDSYLISDAEITNQQFCVFLNEVDIDDNEKYYWLDINHEDCLIVKKSDNFYPKEGYENHPVVLVNWYGAAAFCEWAGGRLPTETEWEYAARSRTSNDNFSGTNDFLSLPLYANLNWEYDKYQKTAPVKTFKPNQLGLYDMTGNVSEWCFDYQDRENYTNNMVNPKGIEERKVRWIRGGNFKATDVAHSNVYYRNYNNKNFSSPMLGFRFMKEIE